MAKPTLTNFRADTLRELRVQAGLSQEAVAKTVGVSAWTYRQWEAGGATPLAGRLKRLASTVGADIADLLGPPQTLADYRVLAGLSQADLAERLGVSRATVGGWEQGLTPVAAKHQPGLMSVLLIPASVPPPWQDTPPPAQTQPPLPATRPRSDPADWEYACASVTALLAAERLASVALRPSFPPPTVEPSWVKDPRPFQTIYREFRSKAHRQARQDTEPLWILLPYHSGEDTAMGHDAGRARSFKVNIEFNFHASMSLPDRRQALEWIGDELHDAGVIESSTPRGYCSTAHRNDQSWMLETSGALIGGAVTSPNSRGEHHFWDQLLAVCHMINNFEGKASLRAGCHVTVGIEGHEHTIVRHENLLRGIRTYEDLLYRLGQNINRRRHRRPPGTTPAPEPGRGYQPVTADRHAPTYPMRVHYAHPMLASGDRIRFRLWDSTLNHGAIQAQIKLSVGMVEEFSTRTWTRHTPVGTHFSRNRRILRRQPGARLRAADWKRDTLPLRELADLLYPNAADREQLAALFASTRWNPPATNTQSDAR